MCWLTVSSRCVDSLLLNSLTWRGIKNLTPRPSHHSRRVMKALRCSTQTLRFFFCACVWSVEANFMVLPLKIISCLVSVGIWERVYVLCVNSYNWGILTAVVLLQYFSCSSLMVLKSFSFFLFLGLYLCKCDLKGEPALLQLCRLCKLSTNCQTFSSNYRTVTSKRVKFPTENWV